MAQNRGNWSSTSPMAVTARSLECRAGNKSLYPNISPVLFFNR
uniref:Uncharacterized protein n=1 Tax=Rhizophora mucronata TaxID=61149 RepID=A0A2P2P683_RHIMU